MSVRTHRIAKQLNTKRSYRNRIEDSSIGVNPGPIMGEAEGNDNDACEPRTKVVYASPHGTGFTSVLAGAVLTKIIILCDPPHYC